MVSTSKLRSCVGAVFLAYAALGRAQPDATDERPALQPELPGPRRYSRYQRRFDHHHIFHDSVIRFEPDSPDLQLWVYTGVVPVARGWGYHYGGWYHAGYAPMYSPVCDGPCAVPMPAGHYQMALSKDGGSLVPVHSPILIDGPAEIRAKYIDRSGTRTAGVIVGIGGAITGAVMLGVAESDNDVCDNNGYCYTRPTTHEGLAIGGVGVILGSIIVGAVLISQHDEAIISVRPLTLGPVGSAQPVTLVLPVATRPPQGGSLSISF